LSALNTQFKVSVLKELQELQPPILMKPLMREYIERLGAVHMEFRAATKLLMDDAQAHLKSGVDEFVATYPGYRGLVVALRVDERGIGEGDPVYMTATVTEYLPVLLERVGSMVNFARRRVEY
jgi:hypothetical protein